MPRVRHTIPPPIEDIRLRVRDCERGSQESGPFHKTVGVRCMLNIHL